MAFKAVDKRVGLKMAKNVVLLKGLSHGSPVHFVLLCQLLALSRYGTESRQRNYM